jgi:hypothetical protein
MVTVRAHITFTSRNSAVCPQSTCITYCVILPPVSDCFSRPAVHSIFDWGPFLKFAYPTC